VSSDTQGGAATQEDVAARAGVSRGAVSLALSGSPKVSEARRRQIVQAATELGYRRNAYAARLASQRSMTIGFVLTEPDMQVSLQVLRSAKNYADEAGWGVMTSVDAASPEQERTAVEHLLSHRVDGIVLLGSRLSTKEIHGAAEQGPLVVVGRRVTKIDSVSVDDRAGARLAVEHLIALGHRRVAHVDGGRAPGAAIRRSTFERIMAEHGLTKSSLVTHGDNTEPGGIRAGGRLLDQRERPTAIFAANDLAALGVLAAARDRGVDVPGDLAVVGFDDTPISALAYVSLTTVSQPPTLGAVAVERLIRRINDPLSDPTWTQLAPELRVRGTTSAPSA
jgi:DNA-binding LacI/PurR family transcriptional regulator